MKFLTAFIIFTIVTVSPFVTMNAQPVFGATCETSLTNAQRDVFLSELEGRLITWEGMTKIYIVRDGEFYWLVDEPTFYAYGYSFEEVINVPCGLFQNTVYHGTYKEGSPIEFPYTERLIKFADSPKVYAVIPECDYSHALSPNANGHFCEMTLQHIQNELDAHLFYGDGWNTKIIELNPTIQTLYETIDGYYTGS